MALERKEKYVKPRKNQGGGGLVHCLDKYEKYFSVLLLEEITEYYEEGHSVEDIAEAVNRKPLEIFIALIHQADEEKLTRPFAYRI